MLLEWYHQFVFDIVALHAQQPLNGLVYVYLLGYLAVAYALLRGGVFDRILKQEAGVSAHPHALKNIDGLRGILAFFVVTTHLLSVQYLMLHGIFRFNADAEFRVTNTGGMSVSFFFMITGYLFWEKFLRNPSLDVSFLLVGRIFRILPLYLIVSVLAILLGAYVQLRAQADFNLSGWMQFVRAFYFGPHNFDAMPWAHLDIGMAWSLKYEMLFYASLPFLAVARRLFGMIVFHLLLVLLLHYSVTDGLAIFSWYLWAGMFAAELFLKAQQLPASQYKHLKRFFCVLVPPLFLGFFARGEFWHSNWQLVFVLFLFFGFLLGANFFGFLNARLMAVLGKISYSTYMLHGCLFHVFLLLLQPFFAFESLTLWQVYAVYLCFVPLLLVVSAFSFYWIERPCMNKQRILSWTQSRISLPACLCSFLRSSIAMRHSHDFR